jgi:prepilin signal peptidase PulO-like enzyme (type II secretory pathway)
MFESYIVLFSTLLGFVVGSFLNVVVLRHGTGRSLLGRSSCASCLQKLSWYELVPVASYVLQRGRCRSCGSRIALQYPLVELTAGLLFGLLALQFLEKSLSLETSVIFLRHAIFMCLLLVILVYDLHHHIIPNDFVYIAILIGVIPALAAPFLIPWGSSVALALLAGPLVAIPLWLLWFVSHGRWMGFGDVKLALALGWFLGLSLGLTALLLSFWVGAAVGMALILTPKILAYGRGLLGTPRLWQTSARFTMKSEVPFAPFLIAGAWIAYFGNLNFFIGWW